MPDLSGRTALVTGASRGIGEATARLLAEQGAHVVLSSRKQADLDQVAADIAQAGGKAIAIAAHQGESAALASLVGEVEHAFGRIDILVNNAGAIRAGDFLATPDAQWGEDWSLKLFGYIRMARAVFPIMRAQGGGRIVNVVGAAARNPTPGYLAGGAANAALVNFTKGLADLGAESGILVTAVSPAATRTERWDALQAQQAAATGRPLAEVQAQALAPYKLGRIADPEDVAALVCLLVSDRATFLTGICVTVDGGATRGVYL